MTSSLKFARIKDHLAAVGHWQKNADEVLANSDRRIYEVRTDRSFPQMGFRFLASPKRVLVDANNRVRALEMEENKLEPKGEDTAAVGLKQLYEFPVDSVVFAVGDRVDRTVSFALQERRICPNPTKTANDPDDSLFQPMMKNQGRWSTRVFLAGWARRKPAKGSSESPSGTRDWCAEVISRYLTTKSVQSGQWPSTRSCRNCRRS